MEFPPEVTAILSEINLIPYENLSKIVAFSRSQDWQRVLESPEKMHRKITELGAGGTCYALTYYLHMRLREKGFPSRFLTAHKYNQKDIHCGLLFTFAGEDYLLDPGYMIFFPMKIPYSRVTRFFDARPNPVSLENGGAGETLRLYTGAPGDLKFRFEFVLHPLELEDFFENWKKSFFLDMMEYPVLNRVIGETQHYIQKKNYLRRGPEGSELTKLDSAGFRKVVNEVFGVSEELIEASAEVFLQKGRVFF